MKRGFASDNNAGVHPEILQAIAEANQGHAVGYGDDKWCDEAKAAFRKEFGDDTDVYFVFNGTGANVLSIQTMLRSYEAVLCATTAHIYVDECGAPDKMTGSKLIAIPTEDGKLTPELVKPYLHGFDFEHHSQPKMISITQVTELGTIYSVEEIKALADLAHEYDMYLHVDGARIANAAAALNLPFRAFTRDAGVDVVSFGGTKNGMLSGEAVLFFNPELSKAAKYYRKQSAQLFSKMRFVGAQFVRYFQDDLWKKMAAHSNEMAQLLADKVRDIPEISITQEPIANGVFAIVLPELIAPLQEAFFFYIWDKNRSEVRWMTSFDTQPEDIEQFVATIKKLLNEKK
ncbi:low specificity L-threonine aldolase [Prolixibacteraceae bacterium JC049]|nr:low specificity L-threonine aldolase [Prolixibacteraceae bacterium JC049]